MGSCRFYSTQHGWFNCLKRNINISKIIAVNSKSGIISKDGPKGFSINIVFDNVKVPFASYQKKSQYNYGFLEVNDYQAKNFLVKFAKDNKSELIIDNVSQISSENNKKIISLVNQ